MPTYKKQIVVIIVVLIFIVGGIFGSYWYSHQNISQPPAEQSTPTKTSLQWTTYHDQKYHFRIDYPFILEVSVSTVKISSTSTADAVSFVEAAGGPGDLAILIEPTSLNTPEEWVKKTEKKRYENIRYPQEWDKIPVRIIDGPITISGYHGVIVHHTSEGFDHPTVKSALFIKDGYLFEINGGSYSEDYERDYQRTWKSFKFE